MPNPSWWLLQVGVGYSLALGSGLVVARGEHGAWSPPSALSFASVGWGLQAGGALHDLLIVLRNRSAMPAKSLYLLLHHCHACSLKRLICSCGQPLPFNEGQGLMRVKCRGHANGITCKLLTGFRAVCNTHSTDNACCLSCMHTRIDLC